MAEGVLFNIAEEVLKTLGSKALDKIASAWGFKAQLEKLKNSINTIRNVLLDAEDKQADSRAVSDWFQRLSTAVYAADDLFDEFNTIATRKQLLSGNRVTKEVKAFFSNSNQIALAFKFSRKIKSIREDLDDIMKDGKDFNLAQRAVDQGCLVTGRRDQTHSFVDEEQVIGRDSDKEAILNLLLASCQTEDERRHGGLPVIGIVGIGGMGKTTLTQLVYNDRQVQKHFGLRLWVCVSEVFDIKVITENILKSATNKVPQKLEMDQLVGELRKEVDGKKYLLVLDDVWENDVNKLEALRDLLKIGRKGSKILVTSRQRTVEKMKDATLHELRGISDEKSWELFEKMAFKSEEAKQNRELVKVGKEIVKKCANVPLAIKTLGRLLWGKDESKWSSFINNNDLIDVMKVLKLSYQHLLSPLKNCFAYCALFPKDYEFKKEWLIELWIAEGFITPGAEGQSLEDVGDVYFHELVQRCFFQDLKRNEQGEIIKFKIHDLMHDLAQQESKFKCKVAKLNETDLSDKILHLSFAESLPSSWEIPNSMPNMKMLRTLLLPEQEYGFRYSNISICQQVVTKFSHLRVLDLHDLGFTSLPTSIGNLIHLRYLNLSWTPIETLPNSITSLPNLQTLNLQFCTRLKTLPSKIHKLVNLISLDIRDCDNLTHMPSGMKGLTLLHKLPLFIVNHKQYAELRKKPNGTAKLSDLKNLNNLRGILSLYIYSSCVNNMPEAMEADITNKHLKLLKRSMMQLRWKVSNLIVN